MKLSIALFTTLSTTDVLAFTESDELILQFDEVVQCFAGAFSGAGDVTSCCPDGSNHPICGLIACTDLDVSENSMGVRDGCTCSQLTPFCSSTLPTMLGALFTGLVGTCDGVTDCCKDEIENDAFESCTRDYIAENELQVPDINGWLGQGVPGLSIGDVLLPGIGAVIPEPEDETSILGATYCSYNIRFDYDCYPLEGKPSCCLSDDEECPADQPPCADGKAANSTTVDPPFNSTETDSEPAPAPPTDEAPAPAPDENLEEPSAPSSASILVGFLWSGAALLASVAM